MTCMFKVINYCLQMFLKTLEISVMIYKNLTVCSCHVTYAFDSNKGYFLEVDVEYPKTLLIVIKIYHFYPKEKRLKKSKNFFVVQKTNKNMLFTKEL